MSTDLERELGEAFAIGARIESGKRALEAMKADEGETAVISKELNPPSMGASPGAGAGAGQPRNWGRIIKIAIAVVLLIGILFAVYKFRSNLGLQKIKENASHAGEKLKAWFEMNSDVVKAKIASWRNKTDDGSNAKFGTDHEKAIDDALTFMYPILENLEVLTKGGTSVIGLDGVRAYVLYGLVRAAMGKGGVGGLSAQELRAVVVNTFEPGFKGFMRVATPKIINGEPPDSSDARQIVTDWLGFVKAECQRLQRPCELGRVLDELTGPRSAFARSAEENHSKTQSVIDVYKLAYDLSVFRRVPVAAEAAAFGAGSKKKQEPCLFVTDDGTRCGTLCDRGSACVCEVHETELRRMYPDSKEVPIALLLSHLKRKIGEHAGEVMINDALAEIEGAAAWKDRSEEVAAFMIRNKAAFGSAILKGAASTVWDVGGAVLSTAGNITQTLVNVPVAAYNYATRSTEPETDPTPSSAAPQQIESSPGDSAATSDARSDSAASPPQPATGLTKEQRAGFRKAQRAQQKQAKEPQRSTSAENRAKKNKEKENARLREKQSAPEKTTRDGGARRREKYAHVDDFVVAGKSIFNEATFEEMKRKFEARKAARDALLAQIGKKEKKGKESTFARALEDHLTFVPLDAESVEQSAKIARRLAEGLVVYRARAQNDTETIAIMDALAKLKSAVRRVSDEIYSFAVAPIPFSVALERHYASAKVLSTVVPEDKRESFKQHVHLVTLALKARYVEGQDNIGDRAIDKTRDELLTFTRACLVPAEAAAFGKRGGKKTGTVPRESRSAQMVWDNLYRQANVDYGAVVVFETCIPEDEGDLDSMLAAAEITLFEQKKERSITEFVVGPSGQSFGTNLNISGMARQAAQSVGAERFYDAAGTIWSEGREVVRLVAAITVAAKVGETMIMELMKLLLDGMYLVKDLYNNTVTTGKSEAVLRSLVTSEEQRKMEKELAEYTDRDSDRERVSRTLQLQAEVDELKMVLNKPKFGSATKSGTESGTESGSAMQAASPGWAERVTIDGVSKAVKTFFTSAGTLIMEFVNAIREAIVETLDKGNAFDLFANVAAKISEFFTGQSSSGNGMYSRLMGLLGRIGTLGTLTRLAVYFDGLEAWWNQPSKIRGLFTDPAGVLEGNDDKRSILRNPKYAKTARVCVITLFLLRLLQIVRRVATGSIVHQIACDTAKTLVEYGEDDGLVASVASVLGTNLQKLVSCSEAAKDLDEEQLRKRRDELKLEKEELERQAAEKAANPAAPKAAGGKFGSRRGY